LSIHTIANYSQIYSIFRERKTHDTGKKEGEKGRKTQGALVHRSFSEGGRRREEVVYIRLPSSVRPPELFGEGGEGLGVGQKKP